MSAARSTPQRAEIRGAKLAYGIRGKTGEPVLLIMGYSLPGHAWVHQIPALARHHRVVWYDNRGSGSTEARAGVHSMVELAEDALALMDHLGWERAHITGVSMGGMIAQELALRWRERVMSLTLIATHAGGGWRSLPALRGPARFLYGRVRGRGFSDLIPELLFPTEFLAACDEEWLAGVMQAEFGKRPPLPQRLSQVAALLRHDTRDRLRQLEGLPTLIVKPALDVLVRPTASDDLQRRIPGSRLLVFPDAGHGLIRQCHRRLNAALLEHYAGALTNSRSASSSSRLPRANKVPPGSSTSSGEGL